jgi:hypothetical protein
VTEDSHRFWSLLPATADTAHNKVDICREAVPSVTHALQVVTGVRFTKIGKVIYPQVEQAAALPEGEMLEGWIDGYCSPVLMV